MKGSDLKNWIKHVLSGATVMLTVISILDEMHGHQMPIEDAPGMIAHQCAKLVREGTVFSVMDSHGRTCYGLEHRRIELTSA